jgi:dephospho-CoA kinase
VKRIVIAGGIGAGKTAVTDHLASLDFPVIDADVVARSVVEKGQPAWRAINDAFGQAALNRDGELDRQFVADVVFHDASALKRLNQITHGYIWQDIVEQLDAASGQAVFVGLPLFRREHRDIFALDAVWAVQVSPATAVARLVTCRGFSEDDAKARIASQISNVELAGIVDRVIWNEGSREELFANVDVALQELGIVRD